MSYFRELPNIKYASVFSGGRPTKDYTLVKNLFKRPKIRSDIKSKITSFYNYTIRDGERPDQIAKKIYNNSEFDWVILITNNITNLNEQWPLDNNSFYSYLLDKYGSEEALYEVHHYETSEVRDEYNRVVIPAGIQVDQLRAEEFTTTANKLSYDLNAFPSSKFGAKVTVNLTQFLRVITKTGLTIIDISDINGRTSNLKIKTRSNTEVDIPFVNNLFNWPNGWGGVLTVLQRNGEKIENIVIRDRVSTTDIEIPEGLYRIVGRDDNGTLVPVFEFRNELAVT